LQYDYCAIVQYIASVKISLLFIYKRMPSSVKGIHKICVWGAPVFGLSTGNSQVCICAYILIYPPRCTRWAKL